MYGQIHCVIRELVQMKFGNDMWETVLKNSGLDEHNSFLMFNRYDDASTFRLVGAVSETLEIPVETVLEVFGEFFFDYCIRHGYDKMLQTLGSDIKSFIQNLDSLHSLLALSYKGISAPSFRCEDGPDGSLILHYYSSRPGLYPIVKGVLKAVARDLFDQSVEMSILEQNKEDIECENFQEHTAFLVQLRSNSTKNIKECVVTPLMEEKSLVSFNPEMVLIRASDFCSAFPYHVIFDRNLRIKQCGILIQKHSCHVIREGTPLDVAFEIVHPKMTISIENIRKFINAVFLLAICGTHGKKRMIVKGQMIWIEDTQHMIFIGSPRLTSLNELMEMNVYLADIPLYDVTRELVLLNQQRIAEIDIAKRLDETTAQLKKTGQALEEEKRKTELLLHQMLPRKVANALTQGRTVEAEKFEEVTILFSDIVTFTNIASACSPMDIVDMLNDMYQRFDELTSIHNVYKVETIGDAYMIVSGVPEPTSYHATPVANFAMDMVEEAGHVMSPATGKPLQIRVGIHTGPVVAGVVGKKMPRYCLFGDTVNTASRMESHGVPARIHLSADTRSALYGWGYVFRVRGDMEVKGKGTMCTYFLAGMKERRISEPEDDFLDLEIEKDGEDNVVCILSTTTSTDDLLSSEGEKLEKMQKIDLEKQDGSESTGLLSEISSPVDASPIDASPVDASPVNISPAGASPAYPSEQSRTQSNGSYVMEGCSENESETDFEIIMESKPDNVSLNSHKSSIKSKRDSSEHEISNVCCGFSTAFFTLKDQRAGKSDQMCSYQSNGKKAHLENNNSPKSINNSNTHSHSRSNSQRQHVADVLKPTHQHENVSSVSVTQQRDNNNTLEANVHQSERNPVKCACQKVSTSTSSTQTSTDMLDNLTSQKNVTISHSTTSSTPQQIQQLPPTQPSSFTLSAEQHPNFVHRCKTPASTKSITLDSRPKSVNLPNGSSTKTFDTSNDIEQMESDDRILPTTAMLPQGPSPDDDSNTVTTDLSPVNLPPESESSHNLYIQSSMSHDQLLKVRKTRKKAQKKEKSQLCKIC